MTTVTGAKACLIPVMCALVSCMPDVKKVVWLPIYSKLGQHYVSGPRSGPAMRLVDYSITSLNGCSIRISILVATWTLLQL